MRQSFMELRWYGTGWTFRTGAILLRYTNQYIQSANGPTGYSALSIERIRGIRQVGGMTFAQYRAAKHNKARTRERKLCP